MIDDQNTNVRLFFAAWPDAATRSRIADLANALTPQDKARRVPGEHYHLTLAFLGNVPAGQIPALRQIGRDQQTHGFSLRFDAYEHWPKPEVIVAAARQIPPTLEALWQRLHVRVAELGIELAPKRLRPHVTLWKKTAEAPQWPPVVPFNWRVREFRLVRSEAGGGQPAYTVVGTWSLLDDAS